MHRYLAIDIGASSGRHIVGWMQDGELVTKEVYRFHNCAETENGHLVWDIEALVREVKAGIRAAKAAYSEIYSLSIDTWGVDYVLLDGERELTPCYAYRDGRTEKVIPAVHELIPFDKLYRKTGIQFQPFNTIYQLYADKMAGRLDAATDFLLIPEYLLYKLTGVKRHEYTNATTGGMVNAATEEYDGSIIRRLGLPERLFAHLSKPGEYVGEYDGIRCILCATHDTASAVEGILMDVDSPYISSGTWSLLGAKLGKPLTDAASLAANFTNEGGVGYIRYLKNIMGMWLVNRLRDELCPEKPFAQITHEAEASAYDGIVDVNATVFLAPESMKAAFDSALTVRPVSEADYFRCAYRSLADSYRAALVELEQITGKRWDKLYIVGGGAKNDFLNRLTELATGTKVIALPIEATALGNIKIQMEADK